MGQLKLIENELCASFFYDPGGITKLSSRLALALDGWAIILGKKFHCGGPLLCNKFLLETCKNTLWNVVAIFADHASVSCAQK